MIRSFEGDPVAGGSWRPERGWSHDSMSAAISEMDHEPIGRTVSGTLVPAEWDEAPDAMMMSAKSANSPSCES